MASYLLIAGTSHTGKSTLAAELGAATGREVFSTDKMGRHPGRPWEDAPPHVLEFYAKMSSDAIHTFLMHHHQNMQRGIVDFIARMTDENRRFILEGAALRPESLAGHPENTICLYAPDKFLQDRMRLSAGYAAQAQTDRIATDAFIARSLRENTLFKDAAQKQGLRLINVEDVAALADFVTDFTNRAIGIVR